MPKFTVAKKNESHKNKSTHKRKNTRKIKFLKKTVGGGTYSSTEEAPQAHF